MSHAAFELIGSQSIAALNLTVEAYRHRVTGAHHLHLAAKDNNNCFLVAFRTVPEDSTGVAHILEHTALCGSRRYPVRDPFFMMLRRSLQTFMNAFTSSDWTAYPFASQSRKDFDNLLNVYLDAAFFPNLHQLDFAQEGCRVEFATPGDPETPLVYRGVVFNEMKGAMSSPSRVLWHGVSEQLFPTTTYRHNSGGDPEHIPDLTWEALRAFHARHYHPSNAVFMTYGDIPAEQHQAVFQERALAAFQPLAVDFHVPDEQPLSAPRRVTIPYALESEEGTAAKTHVALGWLLGNVTDLETQLSCQLLNGVLMDNSSSPLLHTLETTKLGTSPSPLCGLDDSMRQMVFICGLEGSEADRAEAVEALVRDTLARVARDGVPYEQVASVLHQLEIAHREVGGDGYPYGLKLMLNALPAALHGGDPVAALAVDPVLEKLREAIKDPEYVKGLVRRWLLDNPHQARVTMVPDTGLNARRKEREAARLERIKEGLDAAARQRVVEQAAQLAARQAQHDDPEILPKVTIADVPPALAIPEGREEPMTTLPTTWYDQPTNGLVYQQVVVDLPQLPPELVETLPLFTACLSEVGSAGRGYLETQARQAAVTGGLSARATVRAGVDDVATCRGVVVLGSKALVRNQEAMFQLMRETLAQARFDELTRLRELVAQIRAGSEARVVDSGHALAMAAAVAGFSPAAALNEQWGGLTAIKGLKALDRALEDETHLTALAERMEALKARLLAAPRQALVIGEGEHFELLHQGLASHWGGLPEVMAADPLTAAAVPGPQRLGWATSTQVHFCAKAYPTVSYSHPDAPVLVVLAQFLRDGFLHSAIREKGGAYGGGASYDSDSGGFRFYSYRDPRLAETLADFDRALAWLQERPHQPRALEEAILGVISSIDRPASPAGEARRAFHNALHGRDGAMRNAFRQRVLGVTLADLQRVGARHLDPARASVAVVSNAAALAEHAQLELTVNTL